AVASAKKNNETIISITDFLTEDGGTGGNTCILKPVSRDDETDALLMKVIGKFQWVSLTKQRLMTGIIVILAKLKIRIERHKTDIDWRVHAGTDIFGNYPHRRGDDSCGDKLRSCYDSDQYCDG
ncbi:Eukaryotic translation initiation factor 4B, partial [Galemys pyrenaicus]